jgi:phage tail-like protein
VADFPEILTTSRFYLELKLDGSKDSVDGFFKGCSGFQVNQEVVEICEVTPQLWGKQGQAPGRMVRTKIPGYSTFSNLTLRRGLTISTTLWNWLLKVQDGNWADQRRNGALVVYNQSAQEQFRFEFQRGWPMSYKISDLDVTTGEHNIEEIEMTVENLKRVEVQTQV